MKKKAFELSINFLVVLIITLVVFGFALAFAYKFFGKSEQLKASIDLKTKSEIQSLIMSQGMKVAVYPTQISMLSGKAESFGVGILNVVGTGPSTEFHINIACTKYIPSGGGSGGSCGNNMKLAYEDTKTIPNNKDDIAAGVISASKDAPSGTYIFDITVSYGSNLNYGGLQKVYVKI